MLSTPIPLSCNASSNACTCPAVPTPIVSPRLSWSAPSCHQAVGHVDDLGDRDVALPRVAEAHRDVGPHPQPGRAGPLDHRREHLHRLGHRTAQVGLGEALGRTGEDRDRASRRGPAPGPGRAGWARAPAAALPAAPAPSRSRTSSASASCGTRSGRTKLVVSTVLRPAANSRRISSTLTGAGTTARLVLQPVAGADLVDRDLLGQAGQRFELRSAHPTIIAFRRASGWPVRPAARGAR